MAKPYSRDLRERVIDAVMRGEMSRRAAARRSANPWRSNGLSGLNGKAHESLSDTAAIAPPRGHDKIGATAYANLDKRRIRQKIHISRKARIVP